jgi:outer membrane lipoprotein LolB
VKSFLVLLSALLLAACASQGVRLSPEQRQAAWQQHNLQLAGLQNWSLSGRVAVRAGDQGWQAGMRWSRQDDLQEIQLTGPFGGGVVLLRQDTAGVVLRDNRGEEYYDTNAERLLEQVTGWQLPVNALGYWVRGQAIPDAPQDLELDNNGRAKRLSQQQWQITYQQYGEYNGLLLPQRILLQRAADAGQDNAVEVRLAVNGWKLSP